MAWSTKNVGIAPTKKFNFSGAGPGLEKPLRESFKQLPKLRIPKLKLKPKKFGKL